MNEVPTWSASVVGCAVKFGIRPIDGSFVGTGIVETGTVGGADVMVEVVSPAGRGTVATGVTVGPTVKETGEGEVVGGAACTGAVFVGLGGLLGSEEPEQAPRAQLKPRRKTSGVRMPHRWSPGTRERNWAQRNLKRFLLVVPFRL